MKRGRWRLIIPLLAVVAMLAMTATAQAALTILQINLTGVGTFAAANGKARYQEIGGEKRFRVEVEDVALPAGTELNVYVDGNKAGSLKVNIFGDGTLRLNSDEGHAVPVLNAGSLVQVVTAESVLVVSSSISAPAPVTNPPPTQDPAPITDPAPSPDPGTSITLQTNLVGGLLFPAANGTAVFNNIGGEQQLDVEAEDVKLPAGTVLSVWVDGTKVGTITLNAFGDGKLSLNSDEGDTVPVVHSGSEIKVKTSWFGLLVLSGTFQ